MRRFRWEGGFTRYARLTFDEVLKVLNVHIYIFYNERYQKAVAVLFTEPTPEKSSSPSARPPLRHRPRYLI